MCNSIVLYDIVLQYCLKYILIMTATDFRFENWFAQDYYEKGNASFCQVVKFVSQYLH